MSSPPSILNANLRAEMARRNVTQIQLAIKLDMSQPAFSRRLNGEADWTVAEIIHVAEILDIPLSRLLPIEASA